MRPLQSSPSTSGGLPSFLCPPPPLLRDHQQSWLEDFELESGEQLKQPQVAWRSLGNPALPCLVVLGGISSSRKIWQEPSAHSLAGTAKGWWQAMVGPGRALDPERYHILCLDYLGGNGDSESPRSERYRNKPFPAISTRDQARLLAALLEHLGIPQVHSLIGASYGGMVALCFAELFPERLRQALVICAADRPWPLSSSWRHIQREIVRLGLKHGDSQTAMKLARALAMTTYRSGEEFAQRFGAEANSEANSGANSETSSASTSNACHDYLEHCGQRFAREFDPQAYLCLSQSIDSHFSQAEAIQVPVDLIAFASDLLVPTQQIAQLHQRLAQPGRFAVHSSLYGHDAFLKEERLMHDELTRHCQADRSHSASKNPTYTTIQEEQPCH